MVKLRKELPDLLPKTSKLNNREIELNRMLTGQDIIFFSDDWGRYPSTTQHIAKILSKHNRILWIGSLGLRKPQLNFKDFLRVVEKLKKIFNRPEKSLLHERVFFSNPLIIPFHDNAILRKLNNFIINYVVKSRIKKLNFQKPILFTSSPVVADLIGNLNERISVYLCLDDYTLFKGAFNSLLELENKILAKADVVFSVSDSLLKSRVPKSGRNYFLPQGVDLNHFHYVNNLVKPKDSFKSSVIGFFGLISNWVDIDLIIKCAKTYPQYSFLIIGKAEQNIDKLIQLPNLEYLGEIPYKELPAYAKIFDVGLIPFKVNDLTIAVNPIKLIEYFALGIPVLSTNLPEVKKFRDLVLVANSDEEFVKFLPLAVGDNKIDRNELRISKAKDYSWDSIAEHVSQKVDCLIKE